MLETWQGGVVRGGAVPGIYQGMDGSDWHGSVPVMSVKKGRKGIPVARRQERNSRSVFLRREIQDETASIMYSHTRLGHLLSDFAQLPVLPLSQLAVKDANPHARPHLLRRDQASNRRKEAQALKPRIASAPACRFKQRGGTQDSPGEVSLIREEMG